MVGPQKVLTASLLLKLRHFRWRCWSCHVFHVLLLFAADVAFTGGGVGLAMFLSSSTAAAAAVGAAASSAGRRRRTRRSKRVMVMNFMVSLINRFALLYFVTRCVCVPGTRRTMFASSQVMYEWLIEYARSIVIFSRMDDVVVVVFMIAKFARWMM